MNLAWPITTPELSVDEITLVPWTTARGIYNVVADLTATSRDPRMIEFTGVPDEYTEQMAEEFLDDSTSVRWAIVLGKRYCGNIELRLLNEASRSIDVGYSVSPWARTKNVAPRALRLVTEHAFSQNVFRIELRAATVNTASRRVADKAGFVFEGVARGAEHLRGNIYDLAVYSRLVTD
ncbi:GNAT family protein [Rothia sp. LK2588]|uniref:GNAT family N-acetyltransferase n=1 Tax=Rothia sp. LK2588 TaxID=3114369 RepID=UPI0034CF9799